MNEAEHLLDIARAVRLPKGRLVLCDGTLTAAHFAKVRIALEFERRSPAFRLRALAEDWGPARLVREMY